MPLVRDPVTGKWIKNTQTANAANAANNQLVPFIPVTLEDVAEKQQQIMVQQVQDGSLLPEDLPAKDDTGAYMDYAQSTLAHGMLDVLGNVDEIDQEVMDHVAEKYGIPLGIRSMLIEQCKQKDVWHIGLDDSGSMKYNPTDLVYGLMTDIEQCLLNMSGISGNSGKIFRKDEQNMILKAVVELIMAFTPNSKSSTTTIQIRTLSKTNHKDIAINQQQSAQQKINLIKSTIQTLNYQTNHPSTPLENVVPKIPTNLNANKFVSIIFSDGAPNGRLCSESNIKNTFQNLSSKGVATVFYQVGEDADWMNCLDNNLNTDIIDNYAGKQPDTNGSVGEKTQIERMQGENFPYTIGLHFSRFLLADYKVKPEIGQPVAIFDKIDEEKLNKPLTEKVLGIQMTEVEYRQLAAKTTIPTYSNYTVQEPPAAAFAPGNPSYYPNPSAPPYQGYNQAPQGYHQVPQGYNQGYPQASSRNILGRMLRR